jgi:adenine/guanine phosphoribosyltransferase-like PRPP-binding protein
MDPEGAIRRHVGLTPGAGGRTRHLTHSLNGRLHPIDRAALEWLVGGLAARVDAAAVDYVLGFPEGGSIPAYAFGRALDRPVLLASRLQLDVADAILFEEPHARTGTTQYVYGLGPGDRVVIVEDELTSGRTTVNAARALRKADVSIDEVVTLFAIDHPALWRRLRAERLTLHVGIRLPACCAPRPLDGETE